MIKLNFSIYSILHGNVVEDKRCTEILATSEYDESTKLRDILKELYYKYERHNGKYNKDWEFCCDIFNLNELLWSQYFKDEIVKRINYSFKDYKDMTIGDLDKQFHISKMIIPVTLNKDKGASVGNCEGIDFFFHPNEGKHIIPHIHCEYSGETISIDLTSLKVFAGSFKKSKIDFAIEKIKDNQEDLINYWNNVVVNGESMKFKMRF